MWIDGTSGASGEALGARTRNQTNDKRTKNKRRDCRLPCAVRAVCSNSEQRPMRLREEKAVKVKKKKVRLRFSGPERVLVACNAEPRGSDWEE